MVSRRSSRPCARGRKGTLHPPVPCLLCSQALLALIPTATHAHIRSLCVIAGDISPVDVVSHIPVLCEENEIPYVYVPSKEDLGTASRTKRPTSVVLITIAKSSESFDRYKEMLGSVKELEVVY